VVVCGKKEGISFPEKKGEKGTGGPEGKGGDWVCRAKNGIAPEKEGNAGALCPTQRRDKGRWAAEVWRGGIRRIRRRIIKEKKKKQDPGEYPTRKKKTSSATKKNKKKKGSMEKRQSQRRGKKIFPFFWRLTKDHHEHRGAALGGDPRTPDPRGRKRKEYEPQEKGRKSKRRERERFALIHKSRPQRPGEKTLRRGLKCVRNAATRRKKEREGGRVSHRRKRGRKKGD